MAAWLSSLAYGIAAHSLPCLPPDLLWTAQVLQSSCSNSTYRKPHCQGLVLLQPGLPPLPVLRGACLKGCETIGIRVHSCQRVVSLAHAGCGFTPQQTISM